MLLIPTSDWLGHPFPQRLNHIFERMGTRNEIDVLRFNFLKENNFNTKLNIINMNEFKLKNLPLYYLTNSLNIFNTINKLIQKNNYNVVVISNLLAGYIPSKIIKKIPLIFDLSDYFPTIGAGFAFNVNSPFGQISETVLEQIFLRTLKNVTATITCSDALKYYLKMNGINNSFKISNGVSDIFFNDSNKNNCDYKKNYFGNSIIVGYIGSIEFWIDMHPLLKALKILKNKYDIKLLLIGSNLRSKSSSVIKKYIKTLDLEDLIVWKGFIPHEKVPNYIDVMDICTIPFNSKDPATYYSTPNKLFEYFSRGKPVISTSIPEIIKNYSDYVDIADTESEYEKAIEKIIENKNFYIKAGPEKIKIAKNNSWEKITYKYEACIEKVIDNWGKKYD